MEICPPMVVFSLLGSIYYEIVFQTQIWKGLW